MKKLIVKILLFVSVIVVFTITIGKYDNIIIPNDTNVIKLKNVNKFDSLDYLIIGNSYTYSGVDMAYFNNLNFKAFNLGIATSGVEFYKIILEDYHKQNQQPQNILILLSPMTFSSNADNWNAYPIHRYLHTPISNEEIYFKKFEFYSYIGAIKKSFKKGFRYLFNLQKQVDVSTDIISNKGFIPSENIYSEEVYKKTVKLYEHLKYDKFEKSKLEKMIDLADFYKMKGVNIVFYEIPTFKLDSFFSKKFLYDYQKGKKTIKEKYNIIEFEKQLDSTYFRNIDHCNSKGASVYTKFLVSKL